VPTLQQSRPSQLGACRDWDGWSQDSHASRQPWSGVCVTCRRRNRPVGRVTIQLACTVRDGGYRGCRHGLGIRPAFRSLVSCQQLKRAVYYYYYYYTSISACRKGQCGLPQYRRWRNIRASNTPSLLFGMLDRWTLIWKGGGGEGEGWAERFVMADKHAID
jgi:hypothetical protein